MLLTRKNQCCAAAARDRHSVLHALRTGREPGHLATRCSHPAAGAPFSGRHSTSPNHSRQASIQTAKAAASTSPAASSPMKKAVVVGAGPSGCLTAMLLAQQGWQVEVFEKRPRPTESSGFGAKQRSWVLALYPMGIRAIQKAGIDVPLITERRYKGLVVNLKGGNRFVLERPGALVDRTTLANALLEGMLQKYGDAVKVHFCTQLDSVDFQSREAKFQSTADGATPSDAISTSYQLLIGADGSNSGVKQSLLGAYPDLFKVEVLTTPSSQYKSFYGLPRLPEVVAWDPDAEVPNRDPGHFFFVQPTTLKGAFISTCTDSDGTCCGYLAMSKGSFDTIKTQEAMESVIRQAGPLLPEAWVPHIAQLLLAAPVSDFPAMARLSRFWAPGGVVLLGDAAHTVTPALGQGVNSALTDAVQLADTLAKAQDGKLDAALEAFSAARLPEIAALQELELLQGALMSPLTGTPAKIAAQLYRKWCMACYFGLRTLKTIVDTKLQSGAGSTQSSSNIPGAVRNPPMSELLTGNVSYTQMLGIIRAYWLGATLASLAMLNGAALAIRSVFGA